MSVAEQNTHRVPAGGGQLAVLLAISALYIGFGMTVGLFQGIPGHYASAGNASGGGRLVVCALSAIGRGVSVVTAGRSLAATVSGGGAGVDCTDAAGFRAGSRRSGVDAGADMRLLFAMGLFVAFAMATMDIALDALAVARIESAWRPRAAACKLAALSIGAMIGGGAFVAMFQRFGWATLFLCYAASLLLLIVPMLLVSKTTSGAVQLSALPQQQASLRRLIRNPLQRKRLVLLTLTCCVIFPLSALNRLMLIDMQVSMEVIGGVVGTLGPVTMLITAGIAAPIMHRFGLRRAIWLFTTLGIFALAAMAVGYQLALPWLAITGAVTMGAAVGGVYVVLSARILGWSVGNSPRPTMPLFMASAALSAR
jgi:hypothetical protein